jgi:hypothetical protein
MLSINLLTIKAYVVVMQGPVETVRGAGCICVAMPERMYEMERNGPEA